jgi:hypothetical protein
VTASSPTQAFVDRIRAGADARAPVAPGIDWDVVADDLGDGPYAGDTFLAVLSNASEIPSVQSVTSKLLARLSDVAATQEVVGVLCASEPPMAIVQACFEGLQKLADDRARHYGARATALRGALYLAQFEASCLRYLEGDLLRLDMSDDGGFLRGAAAIVGLICSHKPDGDLVAVLERLQAIPEASDEAAYALGLVDLAAAIGEPDRSRALASFSSARGRFEASIAATEMRPDARLFASVIEVILAFANGEGADRIATTLPALREALFVYVASNFDRDGRPADRSWIGQKTAEALHWSDVAVAISNLAESLDQDAWLHPMMVIEKQLFFILCANRTLFRRTASGGFEAAISPRIQDHFVAEKTKLSLLDQWLSTKVGDSPGDEVARLRSGIQDRLEALGRRNPTDAASASSALAAIDSSSALSDFDKAEVHAIIRDAEREFRLEASDPVAGDILEKMVATLRRNEDFRCKREAAALFTMVLRTTLKFVAMRDNAQRDEGNAYLFERGKPAPKEKRLQIDYVKCLKMSDLARFCAPEAQDVGAGRADVFFMHKGYTLVTECKRIFRRSANLDVAKAFSAQSVAYQKSSVRFCALLVLDLFDRGGRSEHVRDRATVEFVMLEGTEYALAVFRLQGRLKTPSALKAP